MKRVPYIEQMNQTECGLCCTLAILQYFGSREKLIDLRNDIECGRDGYSLANLRTLFETRNVAVKTYSAKSIQALKGVVPPCIAFWDNKHFIVVEKLTSSRVYIMDPARGYQKLTYEEAEEHFSNAILVPSPEENFVPRKSKAESPWKMVIRTMAENKLNLSLALLFAVLSYIIVIKVPDKTSDVIDKAIVSTGSSSILPAVRAIAMLAVLYLAATLVRSMNIMICNIFFCRKIERSTFRHLLRLPYKFFELRSSGDILYRMSSLSGFRELFTTQVVSGIVDIGTMVFIIIFMLKKSMFLTLCVIGLSILNVLFLAVTKEPIAKSINNEVTEQSELQSVENECLITISSVKTSGLEDQVYENWGDHLDKLISKYRQRYSLNNIYSSITGTFQMFAPIAIMILGIFKYFKGEISVGEVVAFQSLAATLFASEISIFSSYTQFILANAYLNRVNDIWCEKEEAAYDRTNDLDMNGAIELRDLEFSYSKNSKPILKGISFTVEPGQRVAFVGRSGAGKSSIGKIISGLYEVGDGMVFFDGVDMNTIKKSSFSRNIGVVPQDVYLLSRSIYDNIVMNDDSVTEKDVEEACKAVNIYNEIKAMPMGFNTMVSEMGLNLSGGQRQRIALAKALIHKPKIIVMDEATSALDSVNEKNITEYIRKIGCTQILIAHRLSTIIDADKIFVVSDGKIVEEGRHEELMEKKGEYYELYMNNEAE
ncbi:MAG: peptidase domain-containing ABC transporter [Ruminococcus sp.]|nr:peptidase domain-containing ABC transporter [Ruminococcus sp.]